MNKKIFLGILVCLAIVGCNKNNNEKDVSENLQKDNEILGMSELEILSLGEGLYDYANGMSNLISQHDKAIDDGTSYCVDFNDFKSVTQYYSVGFSFDDLGSLIYTLTKNGKNYLCVGDGGSNLSFRYETLRIKSITDSKIIFDVYALYCDDYSLNSAACTNSKINVNPFVIIKENGTWVISEYTSTK